MRKKHILLILFNLLYSLSLSYVLFNHVFTGRINIHSLVYAVGFGLLSIMYGFLIGDLKNAFLGYLLSMGLGVLFTVLLVRYPIQVNIGSLAAELVTIYSLRNAVVYVLLVISPISLIFLPLGIYLSTMTNRSRIIEIGYILFSLLLLTLLAYNYADYNSRVYSIKLLNVEVKEADVYIKSEKAYLNVTYVLLNHGTKNIEISMTIYKIHFGSEIARTYTENFYGSPLISSPSKALSRSVSIEVPLFKLTRNMVNGKVRVSIIIEMYIKTRFGITPITFEYTNLLPILQL
ncbi:MAG: hypothetical protein NDF54_00870 [archaeon GB-1867-035]|nr:hypothetical protein [Candidatus Culexmicrobium profundum]